MPCVKHVERENQNTHFLAVCLGVGNNQHPPKTVLSHVQNLVQKASLDALGIANPNCAKRQLGKGVACSLECSPNHLSLAQRAQRLKKQNYHLVRPLLKVGRPKKGKLNGLKADSKALGKPQLQGVYADSGIYCHPTVCGVADFKTQLHL